VSEARDPSLRLHAAPFLAAPVTTPRVMFDVIVALVPVTLAALYYYGLGALLVILASIAGCVFTEWLFNRRQFQLGDGTLILTGLLLGLTLPPSFQMWMAFVGGMAAIGLGRLIWGGLGQNPFNPALVGRAFLQAAFPTAITTWRAPGNLSTFFHVPDSTFAVPLMQVKVKLGDVLAGAASKLVGTGVEAAPSVDAVSTATPLKQMWQSTADAATAYGGPGVADLMKGDVAGSLGETAGILILLGGLYLLLRRAFDWRIPASILLSVAGFSALFHWQFPTQCPTPEFMLCSGGLLLGAVFMATDPVTSPMTPLGAWIYGIGIGVLVVLIRVWAALPEGVMYGILLMNGFSPLIDRFVHTTPFGRRFGGKVAK
jgi:electron transport complex protein RnfD